MEINNTIKPGKLFFPFYVAKRYLFAKKSHNVINIITLVSVVGVIVGTMALVIVLSVFNGLESLIVSQFDAYNPDLEISLVEGKVFSADTVALDDIMQIPGVVSYSEVLEEVGLLVYRDRQHLVRMKGVSASYADITGVDTLIREGTFTLQDGDFDFFILGQGVAYMLGVNINDLLNPLHLYIPKRGRASYMQASQAFNATTNFASGIFGLHSEFDLEYVIVPADLARRLLEYDQEVTSIVIKLADHANHQLIQKEVESILGSNYTVKNRFQQQEFYYKIMRSEKWIIFLILSFIMVIAAFNIIGSLTMLVIEKRNDIKTLRSMGASRRLVQHVFLAEGIILSVGGAIAGLAAGAFICWLQATFGIITIQAEGTYIIDVYPVLMKAADFFLVGLTVTLIGVLASILPLRNMHVLPENIM